MNTRALGILQILASGLCFGFLGLFGKLSYAAGLTPDEFLGFRFTLATLVIGAWIALSGHRKFFLAKRDILRCLALGVFGYAVFSSCFFHALTGLSISLTVLLLYTYPIFVTLGARLFLGEHITRLGWVALPLSTLGLALLVWGDVNVTSPVALVFGILAAVFYSAYILCARAWLGKVDPAVSIFYIQGGAAVMLALLHLRDFDRDLALLGAAWAPLLGAMLISTVFAMGLFLAGLAKLRSSEASILSMAEPVTGILVAWIALGETLSLVQATGGALVLLALVMIAVD